MKNGEIKIEKGIKLPTLKWGTKNPLVLAMAKMKDGDSFAYPLSKRTQLSYCANKAGIVIATRAVDETTLRCWRVKQRQDKPSR